MIRRLKRHKIFMMCWLTAIALAGAASQQSVKFAHLTVNDGLSQGSVICILQDKKGFMWFGTQEGLNRYNGYNTTVFKHDPSIPNSLDNNFVIMLAEDSSGVLWVKTVAGTGMLNRYEPATESFTQVPEDSFKLAGAKINSARSQYVDAAGTKWICSGGGLSRVDRHSSKTTVYKHDPKKAASIISDNVYQIVQDRTGIFWVSTVEGLDKFDPKTEVFTHFTHSEKDPKSISLNYAWPLLIDRQGRLWVGTYGGGINLLDESRETFTRYSHNEADPRSLGGNFVYSLYQDRSGVIWAGTADQGVDRFHPEISPFMHIFRDAKRATTLSNNNIQSILVGKNGVTWIGTRDGMNRWDRANNTFTVLKHDPKNPGSIGDDVIQSLFIDHAGTLWAGGTQNGLDHQDPGSTKFIHYVNKGSDPRSISDNQIYAILEDKHNELWFGTYAGGLNKFDRSANTFHSYKHSDSVATSIADGPIFSLFEDGEGTLWIGTFGGGLDRFDREKGTFTHFVHSDTDSTSISDNGILSMCEDKKGNFWIGTAGGLNLLDRQSGRFWHVRERDGLASDLVIGILEDREGDLWMSTAKGICRYTPSSRTFRVYDESDGLQGREFNQGAFAKDPRTGEFYFGGPNGVNVFDPANVKNNPFIPPLVFSSFTRYNTDDAAGRPIQEKGVSAREHVVISYKDNVSTFEFAALSFYNAQKNRYAYRLEGYADNWIQLGTDRRATFTNLDGGEYVLHIRGSNNDGLWNDDGASLRLTVTPPWWKTTWAYGSYIIMAFGFLYSARRVEINRREQKTRIRESELHAKAVEAEKKALQIENDRQTKELEDARNLQLSMLPKEVPNVPGYEIAVFMKTATEVGGDYYDFTVTPEGMLNVAFGDATGHGMQAGTIVTLMKGLFISDAARFDIQNFFNHCSKAIKEIKLGRLYMALTLARFNGKSVSLSSAGMPPAYLHRGNDGAIEEILLKAVPLGSMKNFPYGLYETQLQDGDTLLLLTDGLPEQKNAREEMFDYARVIDRFKEVAASSPGEIIQHLVKDAEAWMDGATQDDDITLMVVRKKAII